MYRFGMALDLPTLYSIAALALIVAGITQLIPSLTGRSDISTMWWAAGHLMMGLANIFIVLQDHLPVTRLGYWPNLAHITAYGLIFQGIRLFDRPTARLVPVLVAILVCVVPAVLASADAHAFRNGYMNAVRAGWDLCVTIVAIRIARRERLHTAWITAFLFGMTIPLFLGRFWLACTGRLGNTVFGPQRGLAIWLAASAISFVIFRGFCLSLMAAERDRRALSEQAQRDPLTGAYNRAKLNALDATLKRPTSLVMIDLDRFKLLNDREGHAAGDAALQLVARLARSIVGERGHVLRMGGDEFLCVMPGTSRLIAETIGERLKKEFADEISGLVAMTPYPTLSIGVATGDTGREVATLLIEADQAMYAVKAFYGGRRATDANLPPSEHPSTSSSPSLMQCQPNLFLTDDRILSRQSDLVSV